jgi:hypothetical protein
LLASRPLTIVGELKVGLCLTFSNAEIKNTASVFDFK